MDALLLESEPVASPRSQKTFAEILEELGGIPSDRVRLVPAPGTATEGDLLQVRDALCELVNGTLVEKPVGNRESFFAGILFSYVWPFVKAHRLGYCTTPDNLFRMIGGNIREPDFSFTQQSRRPNPFPQVGGWCPDLCAEILSPSNTRAEMAMKRAEYFESGARLVWEFEPKAKFADVYEAIDRCTRLTIADTLTGGDVLPGFAIEMAVLFEDLEIGIPPDSINV